MGNILGWSPWWHPSVQKNGRVLLQEDQLLSQVSQLSVVDLRRVQWGLSQNLLKDVPPVPPHWLRTADAVTTVETLLRCYQQEGAQAVLAEALELIGRKELINGLRRSHSDLPVPPKTWTCPEPGLDFVQTWRRKLNSQMQHGHAVLNSLQVQGTLSNSHRDAINVYAFRKHKNRALVDLVLRNRKKAQDIFYQALSQSEPFLLQELNSDPIKDKKAELASVLTEMLETMDSDELRTFQWLVSDEPGESCSPIGREPLEGADRPTTQRLLEKHFGPEEAEKITRNILLKIVPPLSLCLGEETRMAETSSVIRGETNTDTTLVEIRPKVYDDGDTFRCRFRCPQPGTFRCQETGLLLEGYGDAVYQTVPWDMDFLFSKGLRPAGPLFRFTLLMGSFHRLHLPHCQLNSDGGQDVLRVAHVTEDSVDFLTPAEVTSDHVVVDVSGFSCYGLVMPATSTSAISGLVLVFSQLSYDVELDSSLFVLLLPRNVIITQVTKEWKRRIGAEYLEALPECELIPNQTYTLEGKPVSVIQPESAKFVNFQDYNNFLPSFEVQLGAGVRRVELKLKTKVSFIYLIGWLMGSRVVWGRVLQLKGVSSSLVHASDSVDARLLLLDTLTSLCADDFKTFQHLLSLQSDPISLSRLEAADKTKTANLMVQKNCSEGAKQVTHDILRKMNYNELADNLQNT